MAYTLSAFAQLDLDQARRNAHSPGLPALLTNKFLEPCNATFTRFEYTIAG
jgi:hypothetical protein